MVRAAENLWVDKLEACLLSSSPAPSVPQLNTALHEAAYATSYRGIVQNATEEQVEEWSISIISSLLDRGAEVDSRSERPGWEGWTALHLAADRLKSKSISFLVHKGADRTLKSLRDGETALHLAVKATDAKEETWTLACLPAILDGPGNQKQLLDIVESNGYTALHWAIYENKIKTSNLLIDRGADTMALSLKGWNPLSVSLYWSPNYPEQRMVTRKILNSANFCAENINHVTEMGDTPMGYAVAYGMSDFVVQMLERGAKMYEPSGTLFEFTVTDLEKYLDKCISFDSKGKKISDCVLRFDFSFMKPGANNIGASNGQPEITPVDIYPKTEKKCSPDLWAKEASIVVGMDQQLETIKQEVDLETTNTQQFDFGETTETETKVIEDMAKRHRTLLKHPLPKAFLMLKWRKLHYMYAAWIFMKAVYLGLLLFLVLTSQQFTSSSEATSATNMTMTSKPLNDTNIVHINSSSAINIVLLTMFDVLLITFILAEVLQFLITVRGWLLEWKNMLQLALLGISAALTLELWNPGTVNRDEMKQALAFLLPLAYYEFLHELGCQPRLSKYVLLFERISSKFLKFTSIYIGLVFMCAVSFIVSPKDKDKPESESRGNQILGTIVMFLGEVSVPNMDDGFRVAQTIFFLSFIFFIVIVLMNLLNALAVAEVREMFEDVEVETLNSLLTTVSYWENLLHGDPNHRFKWSLLPLGWLARHVLPSPSCIAVLPTTSLYFFPNKAERRYTIWLPWNHEGLRVRYTSDTKDLDDTNGAPWVEEATIKDALLRVNMEE